MHLSASKEIALWATLIGLLGGFIAWRESRWGERVFSGGPGPVAGPIPAPQTPTLATPPHRRIAVIGDTGAGLEFKRVLELIRDEKADAVMHMGDAIYAGETPGDFWAQVDAVLGHDYPYFLAQGNHDREGDAWPAMASHALQHLQKADVIVVPPSVERPRFALVHGGLSLVALGEEVADDDPRFILDQLSRDRHVWKVCGWHKNQQKLQVGGKGDQMGWGVYEACRQMGALVMTAHEHSYHRTRTLTNMQEQTVDPGCSAPDRVCVRPGAVPVFVSGLGGRSIRDQERCLPPTFPYGCKGEWAFVFTSNQKARFGALFLELHVDGDPRKGRGWFKTTEGEVVDRFQLVAP